MVSLSWSWSWPGHGHGSGYSDFAAPHSAHLHHGLQRQEHGGQQHARRGHQRGHGRGAKADTGKY